MKIQVLGKESPKNIVELLHLLWPCLAISQA